MLTNERTNGRTHNIRIYRSASQTNTLYTFTDDDIAPPLTPHHDPAK